MADLSSMSDAELEAIAGGGASAPAGDLSHMSDAELQKIAGGDGALANSADDGVLSGAAKGAATAVIKGAANIPGVYGNLRDTGQYLADRAVGAASGQSYDDVAKRQTDIDSKIKTDRASDTGVGWLIGKLADITNPSHLFSGHDIAAPALEKTGEYTPTSMPGRMAQAGLEGAVSALGPGSGAASAPTASGGALATLKGIGASGREMAPAMIAGGAAAQGTTEATGDPLLGMAAGAALPAVAGKIPNPVSAAKKVLVTPGVRQGLADEQIYAAATNPEKAYADARVQPAELVEGSKPTFGELTGDSGLLSATEQAATHDTNYKGRIDAQQGAQNVARREAINDTQAQGDAMRPSQVLNQHLADLDASTQAAVDRLTAGRDQLTGLIPSAVPAETSGAQLRGSLANADEASTKNYDALYKAVDPEGKLALVTAPVRDAATVIAKSINPDVEIPSALATEALQRAAQFPDVMRFGDLMKFDRTLTGLMRQAKQTGDSGYANLVSLKGVVKDAISRAVDNQHDYEQGQIARGERQPEDNVFNRLAADRERFYAERAGQNAGQAAVGDASAGSAGVSAMAGTQGQAGSGRGVLGRDSGLQGAQSATEPPAPNLDEAAAGRLSKANSAYAQHAQTYDEGAVGKLLDTNGFKGQYKALDSSIPTQSFVKGDKGYETAQTMMRAANNSSEAVGAMQDMAVTRLQEAMGDKPLTEQTLTKWKQQHEGALRAVDEVSPGFSSQFDNAAKATTLVEKAGEARAEALKQAKAGAAKDLLGAKTTDEVRAQVGSMIDSAKHGASQVSDLMQRVGHDADAVDGVRRAGVEHIMAKFSNMGQKGGEPIFNGKFMAYLETHGDALKALYGDEGLHNMRLVAADLERAQQAKDALAVAGSNTEKLRNQTPKWLKIAKGGAHGSVMAVVFMEGLDAVMKGDMKMALGVAGTVAAKHLLGKMRENGINSVNDLVKEGLANPEVGRAMLERAINAKSGKIRPSALTGLAKAISRGNAVGNSLQQPDDAAPLTIHRYADGGEVQADPDFMKHIIDAVAERVRASNPRGPLQFADGGAVYDPMGNVAISEDREPGGPFDRITNAIMATPGLALGKLQDGAAYPGMLANGEKNFDLDEAIGHAGTLAGMATTGGLGATVPEGALTAGLARRSAPISDADLMLTMHNTSQRKLEMMDELGGLPVPSLAITKPSLGFNGYGDVTLVGPQALATPSRTNPVFASDVYSPRFPQMNDDKTKIFKGYTPSGNQRYAPLTMDNVVKEMKGDIRGGEGFNYGAGSLRSAVTPQFRNMEQIQANRDKLISHEAFDPMKDATNEELFALADKFRPLSKHPDPNPFMESDRFIDRLQDYAKGDRRWLREAYPDAPPELMDQAHAYLNRLRDMPTEYFEAKPQRAVRFDELAGAIIPPDQSKVADILRQRGVSRIEEYDPKNPQTRSDAMMKFKDHGFSRGGLAALR